MLARTSIIVSGHRCGKTNANRWRFPEWNEAAVNAIKFRNDVFFAAWAVHDFFLCETERRLSSSNSALARGNLIRIAKSVCPILDQFRCLSDRRILEKPIVVAGPTRCTSHRGHHLRANCSGLKHSPSFVDIPRLLSRRKSHK